MSEFLKPNNQQKTLCKLFKDLTFILLLRGFRAPHNQLLKMLQRVVRKFHFILLGTQAPLLTLQQNLDLIAVFIKQNLPSLLVTRLKYINPEDREKYTTCMIEIIILTRKHPNFTAYIENSDYIRNLLLGHELYNTAQYCGQILEKLMEVKEIKKEVISNPSLIKLLSYAKQTDFLVQGQSLKTLKIAFDENGAETLSLKVAVDFMKGLVGLAGTKNMLLRAKSLEILAFLLNSQKELCGMFAGKTARLENLITTLPKENLEVQRAVLMLLSVFLQEESSVPPVLEKNRHLCRHILGKLIGEDISVPLFYDM